MTVESTKFEGNFKQAYQTELEASVDLLIEQQLKQDLAFGRIVGAETEPILEQARENSETMRRHQNSPFKAIYGWNGKRKLTLKIHEAQVERMFRETPWLRKQDDPLYQSEENYLLE